MLGHVIFQGHVILQGHAILHSHVILQCHAITAFCKVTSFCTVTPFYLYLACEPIMLDLASCSIIVESIWIHWNPMESIGIHRNPHTFPNISIFIYFYIYISGNEIRLLEFDVRLPILICTPGDAKHCFVEQFSRRFIIRY